MRLRYRNAHTHPDGLGWGWGGNKNGTAPKLKRKGHSRLLSKLFYAFWVLNRKLLSQNNVEYDKPLCCIFLVGAWEGGGGGLASKTLIYSIS